MSKFFDNMGRLIFKNNHHEEPCFAVVFNLDPLLLSRQDSLLSTPNTLEATKHSLILNFIHTFQDRFNPNLFKFNQQYVAKIQTLNIEEEASIP